LQTQSLIITLISIATMVIVGAIPRSKGENRFGYRRGELGPEEVF
jgi:hypothetical protein